MKWRYALWTSAVVLGAAACILGWQQLDRFLIRDPRFALASPIEEEGGSLMLAGAKHASMDNIYRVFSTDAGRSVYLLPLAERRRQLLAVEWVQNATITRIWPNRLAVRVEERKPVAFVQLAGGETGLVDSDGVLLPPVTAGQFKLPVVTGLRREMSEATRRERVRRMLKLQAEFGAEMSRVSEIDLADMENLKVVVARGDRALTLYLGQARFGIRLRLFLENLTEVDQKLPHARILDLRLEDRIVSVQPDPEEGAPSAE